MTQATNTLKSDFQVFGQQLLAQLAASQESKSRKTSAVSDHRGGMYAGSLAESMQALTNQVSLALRPARSEIPLGGHPHSLDQDPPALPSASVMTRKRKLDEKLHAEKTIEKDTAGLGIHEDSKVQPVPAAEAAWWHGGRNAKQRRCNSSSAPLVHGELMARWPSALDDICWFYFLMASLGEAQER